jgi:poly-gamma-glutamate capsule biosynthesis protein CapA/YwtB (metallophosphatase superfamily)
VTRRNQISAAIALVGVLLVAVVLGWDRSDASPVVVETDARNELSIVWAGDTMLGDDAVPVIAERGHEWPLAGVAPLLSGDAVVVNGETPITSRDLPFVPGKRFSYATDPAAAGALAEAGVSALALANNHVMDEGPVGLADTRRHAEAAGLVTFGAGEDLGDAERPLLIRGEAGDVGVVALGKFYGRRVTAGSDQAGTVVFSEESVKRGHALAKAAGAEWVVAYANWGENYEDLRQDQRSLAAQLVDAGYDLVIGVGPHVAQGVEYIDSVPVLYSLGNFVFGSGGRFTPRHKGYGLVLETVFTEEGLSGMDITCIVTDNDRVAFQPRPCSAVDARTVLRRLDPRIVVHGSTGRLAVR